MKKVTFKMGWKASNWNRFSPYFIPPSPLPKENQKPQENSNFRVTFNLHQNEDASTIALFY
jgi:hypothetical protein